MDYPTSAIIVNVAKIAPIIIRLLFVSQNISGAHTSGKLTNLDPFRTYIASVSAFTKAGNGNQFSNTIEFTTQESRMYKSTYLYILYVYNWPDNLALAIIIVVQFVDI